MTSTHPRERTQPRESQRLGGLVIIYYFFNLFATRKSEYTLENEWNIMLSKYIYIYIYRCYYTFYIYNILFVLARASVTAGKKRHLLLVRDLRRCVVVLSQAIRPPPAGSVPDQHGFWFPISWQKQKKTWAFLVELLLLIGELCLQLRASQVAQLVKNLPAMWETWVQSLGWKDPLEEKAAHSSILAWRIPWTV